MTVNIDLITDLCAIDRAMYSFDKVERARAHGFPDLRNDDTAHELATAPQRWTLGAWVLAIGIAMLFTAIIGTVATKAISQAAMDSANFSEYGELK